MLDQPVFRKLRLSIGVLLGTLAIGVFGYHFLEGYTYLDAFFMTVITASTVGFEVVGDRELSTEGKIFTMVLVVSTLGTFLYTINTLTTSLVEGEIRGLLKKYRVNKEIRKLKDHVVICGLGRNGMQVAVEMMAEEMPFVIIEKELEVIETFCERHEGVLALQGDATDETVLEEAQIEHAKAVIVALSDDADNVYATLTIRQLNEEMKIIARASNESTIKKLKIAGANEVILPNILGGRKMAGLITKPALIDFVDLISGQGKWQMSLEQVNCDDSTNLLGKSLQELDVRSKSGVLVLGIQTPDGEFKLNPRTDRTIERGEKIFVIGTQEQIEEFQRQYFK